MRFLADVALSFGHEQHRMPAATDVLLGDARRLIATLAYCLSHLRRDPAARPALKSGSVATMLLSGLGAPLTPDAVAAIDAALILCTDHELAQSTFVARIAASAGADMGECIGAAILTQTGMTAARSYERAEDFLRGCRTPAHCPAAVRRGMRGQPEPARLQPSALPGGRSAGGRSRRGGATACGAEPRLRADPSRAGDRSGIRLPAQPGGGPDSAGRRPRIAVANALRPVHRRAHRRVGGACHGAACVGRAAAAAGALCPE
ncbi:MAG: citrate/2-methylcitrate synthase [Acetobacteraceae bacterium]